MAVTKKSGAIIVRKITGHLEVGLLFRKKQRDWSFPKGHIEAEENALVAMRREVLEETGLRVRLLSKLPPISYITSKGVEVFLYMFLVTPFTGKKMQSISIDERLEWIPMAQVEKILSHENLKDYWRQVRSDVEKKFK